MGWKVTDPMNERMRFVSAALQGEASLSELCRQFGISRKCGYKWLARVAELGPAAGLCEQSRVPHHCPHALDPARAAVILELRARHPTWGPRKLRAWLERHDPGCAWPAPSTIGALLARHGLSIARRRRPRATPNAAPLAAVAGVNQTWCADFKGWVEIGARRLTPLTISDAHSRYIIRCQGLSGHTGYAQVRPLFEAAFREHGLPERLRTDNGPPFASVGLAGLSRLAVWWIKLGIEPERIAPGHPEQNGRHERMHRVLKAETMAPPAATARAQQARFDAFVREYNHERPHEALGQRAPAQCYAPSPRAFPRRLLDPAEHYAHGWAVRKVKPGGSIKWGGLHLYVSATLAGERVGLEPAEDGWWNVYFGRLLLVRLDERGGRLVRLKHEGG
jgi:transposase InsO family protein